MRRVKEHVELAARLGSAVTIGVLNGNLSATRSKPISAADVILPVPGAWARAADGRGVTLLLEPLNRYESDWFNTTDQALAVVLKLGMSYV